MMILLINRYSSKTYTTAWFRQLLFIDKHDRGISVKGVKYINTLVEDFAGAFCDGAGKGNEQIACDGSGCGACDAEGCQPAVCQHACVNVDLQSKAEKADLPEGAGGQRIEQVRTFMDA